MFTKTIGKCPTVEISIGDNKLTCLIYTGSMVSTITEKYFQEHLKNDFELFSNKKYLKLKAANGLEIPYIGYIEAGIYVPSLKKNYQGQRYSYS